MSTIENEAWVEAVALATLNDLRVSGGWPPLIEIPEGFQDADEWRAQARAAIRALAPLIIERCAEVVDKRRREHTDRLALYEAQKLSNAASATRTRVNEASEAVKAIRALNHSVGVTEMVDALKTAIAEAGRGKEASDGPAD